MNTPKTTNLSALYTLTTVWFFWSFFAASNGILIPLFKEKFGLEQWQAQLVDFAFYVAYFVGTVVYLLFSRFSGGDLLNKIGYKNGIIYGLVISAVGSMLFYPAAEAKSYTLLLSALFIVGLGFSLQQTATQPFMIAVGPPETGAQRINLGGAVNNFGGMIGPIIVSFAIFGSVAPEAASAATVESVKIPYLILAGLFVIVAIFFWVSKLPRVTNVEKVEPGLGALKYPQLIWGMAGIFVYVGVEVSISSNLGEYLKQTEGLTTSQIAKYVSLFWGSMMIGRWTASIGNFNPSEKLRKFLFILVPVVAFIIVLACIAISNKISQFYSYGIYVLVMIVAYFASKEKPVRLLLIFTAIGSIMTIVGVFSTGKVALFSLISGGLFCSILWPSIFSLGTAGLGKYTNQGSAFMIMMILGGAIIPVFQGLVADLVGIQLSYLVAAACFIFLFVFGISVQKVLKNQGIDFDAEVERNAIKGGH